MSILIRYNNFKMEQIYKNLYKDENGKYLFATDEDTRYVVEQQSYILVYILELLITFLKKEEETDIFLSNEKGEENET